MSNQTDSKEVFISHSHKQDADSAHRLARDLEKGGHRPWIAPDSIPPGDNWAAGINRGLTQSDALVVVMTPAAIESQWVNLEVYIGIQRKVSEGKLFIPLDFAECAVPVLWSAFQFVSFRKSYQDGLKELLTRLAGKPSRAAVRSAGKKERLSFPKQATRNSKLAMKLLNAAANTPVTAINPQAALFKFAQDTRLGGPESDEFKFSAQGNTYVGQLFNQGIAYAKLGDWGNVKALSKPEGL